MGLIKAFLEPLAPHSLINGRNIFIVKHYQLMFWLKRAKRESMVKDHPTPKVVKTSSLMVPSLWLMMVNV